MKVVKKEHPEQVATVDFLFFMRPKVFYYAVPNGGSRNIIEAANLKKEGVVAGIPDLCICQPRKGYHGLYIEMKAKDGGRLTKEQRDRIFELNERGYLAVKCHGFNEAEKVIRDYFDMPKGRFWK